ncbi:DNA recombination protein RmuC [Metamycoplasma neophronis]|uniref:DNA recombination protein RmuC n=1 Tax=Metamycoplasma neophronis TaxID=872983 RepID=A0ABY2YZM0_9BACT|nr:DNA recombination protein RmuC [Metamycoplasma neophronis]TPR53697.1 DNA recombination protein RmuC [Metamycoplasma neophronis]
MNNTELSLLIFNTVIIIVFLFAFIGAIVMGFIHWKRKKGPKIENLEDSIRPAVDESLKHVNEDIKNALSDQFIKMNDNFNTNITDLIKENNNLKNELYNLVLNLNNDLSKQNEKWKNDLSQQFLNVNNKLIKENSENKESLISTLNSYKKDNMQQTQDEFVKVLNNMNDAIKKIQDANANEIAKIQENTAKQVNEIKGNIDAYFKDKLENKLNEHFNTVSQKMYDLSENLVKFDTIKSDIVNLSKNFTNSKDRGNIGEFTLREILKNKYGENTDTWYEQVDLAKVAEDGRICSNNGNEKSSSKVDFVVRSNIKSKLPWNNGESFDILIPIDSKFPTKDYQDYIDARTQEEEDKALSSFASTMKRLAKDISEKYLIKDVTTETALLYIPSEKIYSLVYLNQGLYWELLNKYNVLVVCPNNILWAIQSMLAVGVGQQLNDNINDIKGIFKEIYDKYDMLLENIEDAEKSINKSSEKISRGKKNLALIYKKIDTNAKKFMIQNRKATSKTKKESTPVKLLKEVETSEADEENN